VAVGLYVDKSGHYQGLIETWSGGAWKAERAPLPPDAAAVPQPTLSRVACSANGSCVAVGSYAISTTPFSSGLLLSLSGGVWKAKAAVGPDGRALSGDPFTGVGCNASGGCTAVGNYSGTDVKNRGMIAFFHGGWKTITAPLPADHVDPATGGTVLAQLNGVSCSINLCTGVGVYETSSSWDMPLAEAISPSSATANSTQGALPADANRGVGIQIAPLTAVSCSHDGPCAAFGQYYDTSFKTHALLEPLGGAGMGGAIRTPGADAERQCGDPERSLVPGGGRLRGDRRLQRHQQPRATAVRSAVTRRVGS
jgi:hypothetical protein